MNSHLCWLHVMLLLLHSRMQVQRCLSLFMTLRFMFLLIMGMDSEAGYQKLVAKIPLKELSNYSISLSSITGGRASFTTKFASYELVPNDIQQKLISEHESETAEEA